MHVKASPSFAVSTPSRRPSRYRYLLVAAIIATSILAGCASRTTRAPVTTMPGNTGSGASAQGTYVVQRGDTLYKIAQQNNMDVATLTRLNNITDPSQLRVGQTLKLSGTPSTAPVPSKSEAVATPVTPVAPTEPVAPPPASDANIVKWGWPAQGTIIQSFNSNTKGIDIAGTAGDPVLAAADGKVMYAGNGVRGLGNLILLGHGNGFITAYAHNQALLVKTGQQVHKGDKIATIGQTDTTSPRLHFEIRRRGTPVNPLSYLPAR